MQYKTSIQTAIDSEDSSICEQITNKDWKKDCIDSVDDTISIDKFVKNKDLE